MKTTSNSKTQLGLAIALGWLAFIAPAAWAQSTGDFRSIATGDWSSTDTWERYSGAAWVGGFYPTNQNAGAITIQSGHTVTISASVTSDQVTIDAGGQVTVNSGQTWTIQDPSGTDLTVNGTLNVLGTVAGSGGPQVVVSGTIINAGTITGITGSGSSLTFNAASLYQHNQDGGTIPTATWNATSTCDITGAVSTVPSGLNQKFGDFIWNCAGQSAAITLTGFYTSALGGNFTVANTGSGSVTLAGNVTVGASGVASVSNGATLNCSTFLISGGTFTLNSGGTLGIGNTAGIASSGATGNIRTTTRNFDSAANYTYNGTAAQVTGTGLPATLTGNLTIANGTSTGVTLSQNTTVNSPGSCVVDNGGLLTLGSAIIVDGTGTFTLSSGGTLAIASTAGITAASGAGNIQTTTRNFDTGANYTYNGTAAQVTGDGLPATVNNLTMANTADITLSGSVTVNGALTLNSGVDVADNGFTLTINGTIANSGSHSSTGSGKILFNGSSAQSFAGTYGNVELNNAAGTSLSGTTTINGNLTVTTGTFSVGQQIAVSGATLVSSTLSITATAGTKSFGDLTINGTWNNNTVTEPVAISGNLVNNGTFNAGAGVYTISGTAKTLNGTLSIPSLAVTGTYENTGALTVATALTGAGTLTQGTSATLNLGGTATITGLNATANPNTVTYDGTTQTVKATTYHHLTISNSGIKTLGGSVTIGGDLTVSTATLNMSTYSADRATAGGTLTLASGATLRIGGTGTLPANYSTHSIDPTSTIEYYGTTQTIATLNSSQNYGNLLISTGTGTRTLAGNIGIAGDLTVNAGTLDLSTFTVNRTSAGGTLTVAASSTLKIGGTGSMPANFSSHVLNATSTVEYSGAAQTVTAEAYGNLTTSGTGTKTLTGGATSIAGALTIGSGTTLDAGTNDISITGAWVNNGTFTGSGTQTVTYTGAGNISISGATTFNSLTVSKASGTLTANTDFSVASVFTIASGTFNASSRIITLSGSGTPLVQTGGTFTIGTSTIKYTSATGANVTGTTYYHLTLDSTGQTFIAGGDIVVGTLGGAGVLTVATGTTFNAADKMITLQASGTPLVVDGTFNPSTSTVSYTSTATAAANIAGVSYYNLTVAGNGSGDTFTAAGDLSVASVLTVGTANNAVFNASSRTITLSGAGTPLVVNGSFAASTSTIRYTSVTGANVTGGLTYNNLTLDSSGQTFIAAGNITNASVLTVAGGTTFNASSQTIVLSGSGAPLVVSGTFTPSTSTVIYSSASGATVGSVTYNNLSFSGTGLFSLGGDIGIAGTCTVASGNQLGCGTSVINGAGTFTLASGGNLLIGSTAGISASASSGNVQTTTRSFDTAANYIYNGAAAQITGNGLPATVNNLTNNNSAGLTLSGTVSVSGTLALTSGKITTGIYQINVPATLAAIPGAGDTSYVIGNLQRSFNTGSNQRFTYPIGDVAAYAPISLGVMNVTTVGSVMASTTSGEHPDVANSGIDSAKSVNRYWTLTAGGIAVSTYNVTNTFVAGDIDGGANTSAFVVRRKNGSWAATTTGTRTATSTSATGLSSFSDFAVGEQLIDHYAVTGPLANNSGVPFTNTVTAQDILNQTVAADSSTVVTMSSSGSAQFDSNNDDVFGDNTKTLTAGTFTIRTKDNVGETINITATDGNSKTGTLNDVVINAAAGAYRTAGSGDWNSTSTWETFDGVSWNAAVATPSSADGVITIRNGHIVTVAAAVAVDQVIVQPTGQVNINSGITWTIANGAGTDVEVFGIVQNAGTVTVNTGADLVFQSGGKYQHNFTTTAGVIPTATWASGSTCEIIGYTSNTATLSGFGQSFHHLIWNCPSQTGTMNLGTGAATVNGDCTVTTTGSGSIVLGNNMSVVGNLTVSAGTFDLAALTANRTAAGGTLTLANGATLRLSGASNFPANYTTRTLGATSTVEYYSGGNQTVSAESYGHLTLSGVTTIKTLQTGTTIAGDLTLSGSPTVTMVEAMAVGGNLSISGGTLTVPEFDFSVAGTTTVSGGNLVQNSATGAKTYTGLVTISGGTWNNSGNAPVNFRGGLAVSSGTFTAGAGVQTFDTNDQTVSGTVTIPSATVTGVNLTNDGTLTISTALNGTGALINGATGTLNLNFTGSVGIATLTASASGNTVNYGAAGDQTVVPIAYHNLGLGGSGTKTMTGVTTIGGDLTISGSATMTGNAAFTVTGTMSYSSSGSTTLTASTPISVGKLNQTAGTLDDNGNTITVTGTGATTWTRTSGTFTTSGTAIFNGTAPEIGAANFNHLSISGTAATVTTAAVTVAGNLDIGSGAAIAIGNTMAVSGNTTINGILNQSSTSGTETFSGDVTINAGGMWTNGVNETVTFGGSLTNEGTFVAGTGAQTFTGTAKAFAGASEISIPSLTLNGTYENAGTLTISTAFAGSGTLTQGTGTTLNVGDSALAAGITLVATANPNTVVYNRAGNQTVKATAYHHLILTGSGAKSMGSVTDIAGDLTISDTATMTGNAAFTVAGAFNYSSGGSTTLVSARPISVGTFNQTAGTLVDNGNTITVTGTGANTWTESGTFTATGTVIFTGAAPQIGASNFRSLTIAVGTGNTATLTGAITTAGTLTINSGTTLADGGFTITANGDVANSGTYNGAGKISLTGGTAAHTLSGTGNYANLEMNDANGATLTGSPTINGTLTFITGRITTGANSVILPNSATVSGAGAGAYVAGNLQRDFLTGAGQSYTFAIGGAANYAPIDLTGLDVTTAGSLTASTTDGDHANLAGSGISAIEGVNRYWTLTAGGMVISTCDATYNFDASDVDAGADTSKFLVRRYSGGSWTTTTLGTRAATSISITGLTGFSDFAAGEQGIDHYDVTASSPQLAGATFTTTVTARDALNELVVEDSSTVVTMTSSTSNAQYDSNGDTTFGDNTKTLTAGTFTIDTKDNVAETVDLIATDGDSKTGTRDDLVITPEAAQYLAFSTQPGLAVIGAPFGTQPVIKTRDQFGNDSTVGLAANLNVTVALTAGTGPLQGTTTLDIGTAAGNGTVTFTDLQIDVMGADKQLTASATDFTNAISAVFTVKGFTTNEVTSSSNPSLPGANVTFTATLSAVSPATGTPTGTIQFVIDGTPFGSPVELSGGIAVTNMDALSHGTHTVAAEYLGDGDFVGSTNSLSPDQLVNTPPVAAPHTLGTTQNKVASMSTIKMLKTDSDADGDAMSITNVSAASAEGGSVSLGGTTITYTPPTDYVGADSFTYILVDSFGATNIGTVNVTVNSDTNTPQRVVAIETLPDNNVAITFAGIPGYTYFIQANTNLATSTWTNISTNVAGANGLFTYSDLEATNYVSRYYRSSAD